MDTKTQNIAITILGLVLVVCLWFTFSLFGKAETSETATPYAESPKKVDLDFDKIDVDIEELRAKFGDNIDSAYAAAFPEDEVIDYSKMMPSGSKYASNENVKYTSNFEDDAPQYMVIAGAFSTDDNAKIFQKMLQDKGYPSSEIVQFKNSKYTSICVQRTDDLQMARSKVEALKSMNIEAYVHTRKTSK